MDTITQVDRDAAALKLATRYPSDAKIAAVCAQIRAGKADDHPSVQANAFYRNPNSDHHNGKLHN